MENTLCKDCTHFRQHYGLNGGKLYRIYCGHCTFEKVKRKLPDTKACIHFVSGSSNEEAFVRKEYLTKKVLQYVLDMQLLPEITDLSKPEKTQNQII